MKYRDLAFDISCLVHDARIEKGWTQAQLARKLKTKQPSIARLEKGKRYPSLHFLNKVVRALGMELIITFKDANDK
jgi:transcriptional regulator with XRE-family HTH domain